MPQGGDILRGHGPRRYEKALSFIHKSAGCGSSVTFSSSSPGLETFSGVSSVTRPSLKASADVRCHLEVPLCVSPKGISPQVAFGPSPFHQQCFSEAPQLRVAREEGACCYVQRVEGWLLPQRLAAPCGDLLGPWHFPPQLSKGPQNSPRFPLASQIFRIPKMETRCQLSPSGLLASASCTCDPPLQPPAMSPWASCCPPSSLRSITTCESVSHCLEFGLLGWGFSCSQATSAHPRIPARLGTAL